ncbi:sugar ABC transporter ATP-binding protein [Oceanispirochaeta sp.]|uniref:sugar ABC transporter ATP-binding protein n=1 Tax=Oceanispirochaeta sp. TaxID=2035350 RepID=UPI00262825E5|nr:sugar ABC transporter ATP-binding protein [Oceanispirochaeta sp.]MDA3955143.1 sugar ABC transporter ATP-binding protein [Oceanispirochaeta sp.]
MDDYLLELKGIRKEYPGVVALKGVSLGFREGEVHAIVGENGAGKSTFIKIITGAIEATSGDVYFEGQKLKDSSPAERLHLGITAIYQEFNLFDHLSVAENIYYNRYDKKRGFIDYKSIEKKSKKVLDSLGVLIDPKMLVKDLTVGYQQLVEIAKSVSRTVKIMIMDEPSAPLTNNELEYLFRIVEKLKIDGIAIIYISHRLEEIFEICDKVSVFRDGEYISTSLVKDTNKNELIKLMVNRDLDHSFPQIEMERGEKVLEVKNLNTSVLKDVSFSAFKGEKLGFAGLVGAGRTEVARVLFGADRLTSGEILIDGKKVGIHSPKDGVQNGIGLIPEDRKQQGTLLHMNIKENISFAYMKNLTGTLGIISDAKENKLSAEQIRSLKIKTPSSDQLVKNLSGGNQQKVVLAKWLLMESKILIFDEPTRGIDVGAKQEIYNLINELALMGKVIIMISSEMPELIGMSDRILVMAGGKITGELSKEETTQEKILELASVAREVENAKY